MQVYVGSRNLDAVLDSVAIEKIHQHPAYNPDETNMGKKYGFDLAIAVIVGTFHFAAGVIKEVRWNQGQYNIVTSMQQKINKLFISPLQNSGLLLHEFFGWGQTEVDVPTTSIKMLLMNIQNKCVFSANDTAENHLVPGNLLFCAKSREGITCPVLSHVPYALHDMIYF